MQKISQLSKNGILMVNFNSEYEEFNNSFYDTENFEIYCFCQISILNKSKFNILEDNIQTIATNYFLVGGFERKKSKGMIKLFKIIYDKNFLETKIEYIQDIEIKKSEEFKGFNGAVNNIIQIKKNLNILIACMDGNIYLFKPSNIDYFLFYDK